MYIAKYRNVAADHSTAGIIVALCVPLAGLVWPSLASSAYMLVFVAQIWRWAIVCHATYRFSLAKLGTFQFYTGQSE